MAVLHNHGLTKSCRLLVDRPDVATPRKHRAFARQRSRAQAWGVRHTTLRQLCKFANGFASLDGKADLATVQVANSRRFMNELLVEGPRDLQFAPATMQWCGND